VTSVDKMPQSQVESGPELFKHAELFYDLSRPKHQQDQSKETFARRQTLIRAYRGFRSVKIVVTKFRTHSEADLKIINIVCIVNT